MALEACMTSMKALLGIGGASKSAALLEAERHIPEAHLRALHEAYDKADGSEGLDKAGLQALMGLTDPALGPLPDWIWAAVCSRGMDGSRVTLEELAIAKWHALFDGDAAGVDFAYGALRPDAQGHVAWSHLEAAVRACLQLAVGRSPAEAYVQSVVRGAQSAADSEEGVEKHLTRTAFAAWAKRGMPAVAQALRALLAGTNAGGGSAGSRAVDPALAKVPQLAVPQLISLEGVQTEGCLLQPEAAWALAGSGFLPPARCKEWRQLYHSGKHGQSFSTLVGRCSGRGATLLLVKDGGGHVFGGCAGAPWERHGDYFGTFDSFVFSLQPAALIYRASGVNQNFQFLGQNFTQVPNGIGFGGQLGYFGLFVDGTCDHGMSRECSTFKSPSLSSSPVFDVAAIEVWQVDLPEPVKDDGITRRGGSALDKRREDRNLMELAGRKMSHAER